MPWLYEPRLNQPMSSPIMTRMLGFLSAACAEARTPNSASPRAGVRSLSFGIFRSPYRLAEFCCFSRKVTVSHFGLCVFFQGNCWRDEAAIGERRPDSGQEVGSEPRLNDITEPARIECGPGKVGVFVDREEDQARRPVRAMKLARRLDAVEPWHGDVQDDDIRMEPLRLSEQFASIAHLNRRRNIHRPARWPSARASPDDHQPAARAGAPRNRRREWRRAVVTTPFR